MWSDWEEFAEALEGEFGEEAEEEALDFAEESGMLEQWEAEDGEGDDQEYMDALGEELGRVEHAIGRQLTKAEEVAMLNSVSTEEFGEEVPNFVAQFGEQLASAPATEEGRVHLGAEAAQQAMDEQEKPATFDPPPPPPGPEGPDDDEGYEAE